VIERPQWFANAIEVKPTDCVVDVAGCPIHYLKWGAAGRAGIVFVHGGAAHAHWWSFIAPLFVPEYQVVAIDLSGHGDSGRRDAYPRSKPSPPDARWSQPRSGRRHSPDCRG
jgi:pimeloyl-ACP methyl ester carboxylesterase